MKIQKHFLVFLLCWISLQLSAQFSIGLRSSYIKAWEDYESTAIPDEVQQLSVSGFQVSVLAYLEFNQFLKIGVEPGFIQRGATFDQVNYDRVLSNINYLYQYVDFPIMIAGNYPLFKGKWEMFTKLGYSLSVLNSAYRELEFPPTSTPYQRSKINLSNDRLLKRIDQGINSSLGLARNFGRNQLFVEANYYHGLN